MNEGLVPASVLFFGLPWLLFCMDGQVVHVDGPPSLCNFSLEDHVHHHLKGSGRVGQPKEHHGWFKESFGCEEGCFPFIPLLDVNIVVSPIYIELGKKGASSQVVNSLGNERGNVSVLLGPAVDWVVVTNRSWCRCNSQSSWGSWVSWVEFYYCYHTDIRCLSDLVH